MHITNTVQDELNVAITLDIDADWYPSPWMMREFRFSNAFNLAGFYSGNTLNEFFFM